MSETPPHNANDEYARQFMPPERRARPAALDAATRPVAKSADAAAAETPAIAPTDGGGAPVPPGRGEAPESLPAAGASETVPRTVG